MPLSRMKCSVTLWFFTNYTAEICLRLYFIQCGSTWQRPSATTDFYVHMLLCYKKKFVLIGIHLKTKPVVLLWPVSHLWSNKGSSIICVIKMKVKAKRKFALLDLQETSTAAKTVFLEDETLVFRITIMLFVGISLRLLGWFFNVGSDLIIWVFCYVSRLLLHLCIAFWSAVGDAIWAIKLIEWHSITSKANVWTVEKDLAWRGISLIHISYTMEGVNTLKPPANAPMLRWLTSNCRHCIMLMRCSARMKDDARM